MHSGNLYHHIPTEFPAEISECLLQSDAVKIERIVSRGHASEPDFWYNQNQHEWVLLMQGEAKLRFKNSNAIVHLTPGSYLNIPAHVQHQVEWTLENQVTIWLAIFY